MGGRLTTHVLDVAAGRPAAGVELELSRREPGGGTRTLARARTNADGRTDAPLLEDGALEAGRYELTFRVGAYYARRAVELPDPPFLDDVAIRFGVADADAHHHVPLLVSPWSYATYRGS
ncbi:MAG TPA: hydroxyisourate hydrolase [Conexibacter sp.]|nr:hydroxyisourate hydrolase [Conexibacter sp.]